MRYAQPKRIIVIAAGGHHVSPRTLRECPADWIHLDGDLGHIHHINSGQKPFDWSGFTVTLCTLALLAYQDECDLIFCEQDMLAFGPWVETMYAEIGDAKVCYGTGRMMKCFQSLMLIKHDYLPMFVATYMPAGATEKSRDAEGEVRMEKLTRDLPCHYKAFSFPYDRDRPINPDLPVFYVQQIQIEEMEMLKGRGLV